MRPQEWTRFSGTTNAPSASEEAEQLELGRRVAQERGYQSALFDDPADYAWRKEVPPMRGCGCLLAALFLLMVIAGSLLTAGVR
jgi:hypothetical protein